MKGPALIESFVLLLEFKVGFGEVLQQTPLANNIAPPLLTTIPPQLTVEAVIELTLLVCIVAMLAAIVVKDISGP